MSSNNKHQGTVKWFSNKKGYGFITPIVGEGAEDDIFVHQSSILSEGYRTLGEGWTVEYEVTRDENNKIKATNVTAPGGGPCTGPRRKPRRSSRRGAEEEEELHDEHEEGGGGGGRRRTTTPKPKPPSWHDDLDDVVKESLDIKQIRRSTGTIDVAIGESRIKLGTSGYTSMAHASGILAEGIFTSDHNGYITFEWQHAIEFDNGEWKPITENVSSILIQSLELVSDEVGPVGPEETAETLWGDDKTDPKEALEANNFQMRRVVLTPRGTRGRR